MKQSALRAIFWRLSKTNAMEPISRGCDLLIGKSNYDHATSPKEGAWSALFSNLSKSGLDNYVVKRFKRPLLQEVS